MSVSDYFHDDLLCREKEDSRLPSRDQLTKFSSSSIESLAEFKESVAQLVDAEKNFVPGLDYVKRLQSRSVDESAREESVAWIVKIKNGWSMQLLSVACLSLAAKMEEPRVPSLLDLQIEGSKFVFESRIIQRMELLVLSVLDWRLRSITPFTFLSYFASKLDNTNSAYTGYIISKSTEIIMSNIQEICLLEYLPSCIAAATILHVAQGISYLPRLIAETWFDQELIKERVMSCYELIEKVSVRKPPKVLSQLRVMTTQAWIGTDNSPPPLPLLPSASSSSLKRKRGNEVE